MSDETQDGFNRIKELAERMLKNMQDGKLPLLQARALIANIDVLEAQIKLEDE